MHADGEIVFQGTFESLLRRVDSVMLTPREVKRHLASLLSSPSEKLKKDLDAPLWFTCETSFLLEKLARSELALPITCRFHTRTANVYVHLAESNEHLAFLVTTQANPIL